MVTIQQRKAPATERLPSGKFATTAPADNLYTTSIPTATNAGTYYVWYKVFVDENHSDSEAKPVEVKKQMSQRLYLIQHMMLWLYTSSVRKTPLPQSSTSMNEEV